VNQKRAGKRVLSYPGGLERGKKKKKEYNVGFRQKYVITRKHSISEDTK